MNVAEIHDDAVILDVREPNEYAAGRARGAVSIPLGEVRARIAEIKKMESPVHVTCRSGVRSEKAATFLASEGVNVINVDGGMMEWQHHRKPMIADGGVAPDVVTPATPPPTAV